MEKTLKSILAITLALVMSFGTLTAFAAEGDTLEWIFDGEYSKEYTCYGEFKEGKNIVLCSEDSSEHKYYDFNAKEGYYSISYTNPDDTGFIGWLFTPYEFEDGKAYDYAYPFCENYYYDDNNEHYTTIFKFDAGETVIGVNAYCGFEDTEIEVNVEYLGESITDFDIPVTELVLNSDIYEDEPESYLYTDISITFDETTTIDVEGFDLSYTCDEIKEGENVLTFELEDVTKDITVTINPIEYYVKDIELHDADFHAQTFVDYSGSTWYYEVNDAVATVTFTNGSEKDIFFYYGESSVELSNGKEYPVYAWHSYDYDSGERYLKIYLADYEKKYKCTEIKYDIIENGSLLIEDNKSEIGNFFDDISDNLDDATDYNSVAEIFTSLFGSFFDTLIGVSDLFGSIFENIVRFIKFYLVG